MDLHLSGKTVLITASTGGIGWEIANSFLREGATVIVNGRSRESVHKATHALRKERADADMKTLVADNGTAEGCAAAIAQYPDVDILVNNLGIYEAVDFFDETDAAWQRLFEANVMSGVRLARHYLRRMLDRNAGRIVFVASEAAVMPAPEMAHYSATKAACLSISRSLAELTKGTKVTVNAVMPGSTRTDGVAAFVRDIFPGLTPEEAERRFMRENRPTSLIERLISPREVGDFVAFVCSPLASAINGAALRVDGGLVRTMV